ncbi:MAG TPA: hypothetical protein VFF00_09960 [Candidatus Elarobacter sp.]|nr:hypothetical protein [Candidatus Elarobacter sp.]
MRARARGDFFFASNDELRVPPTGAEPVTLIGIAHPHALHVFAAVAAQSPVREALFLDVNRAQLRYLHHQIRTVAASSDRFAYLERLLCVRFEQRAVELLGAVAPAPPGTVRGTSTGAEYAALEAELWRSIRFDAAAFARRYGRTARAGADALVIESELFGRPVTQHLHLIACGPSGGPRYSGTFAFGCGALASDAAYRDARRGLAETPLRFLHADLADRADDLLRWFAYEPVVLSCSNVFHDFFVSASPRLRGTAERIARYASATAFPALDLTLVADRREPERSPRALLELPRRAAPPPRNLLLRRVVPLLRGDVRQVTAGEAAWPLPGASATDHVAFLAAPAGASTTVLHDLLSDGVARDAFRACVRRAVRLSSTVVVVERSPRARCAEELACALKVPAACQLDDPALGSIHLVRSSP